MSATCPACGEAMSVVPAGPCEIDLCRSCDGLWFDHEELRRILDETPRVMVAMDYLASATARKATVCPRCSGELREFEFAGLPGFLADRCQACRGIWLDGGEIRELRRRLPQLASITPAGTTLDPGIPLPRRREESGPGASFAGAVAEWFILEAAFEIVWGVICFCFERVADA